MVVIITCLGLFSYGFSLLTISALRETVVVPTQTALARANDPLWDDPIAPVWSVIVVRVDFDSHPCTVVLTDTQSIDKISLAPGVDFGSAVNVTPLWDTQYLLTLLKSLALHPLTNIRGSGN